MLQNTTTSATIPKNVAANTSTLRISRLPEHAQIRFNVEMEK
jgi:hypothetical protein